MTKFTVRASLMISAALTMFAANAHAEEMTGAFEVGAALTSFNQSDDTDGSGTPVGVYLDAFVNVPLSGALDLNISAKGEYLNGKKDDYFYDTTPNSVGALAAALNYHTGALTVGAFGSLGATNRYEDNRLGFTVGGQAAFDLGKFKPFAQVGFADIRVDDTDSGFTGLITRGGVQYNHSDKLALTVDGGYGYAPSDYEDEGDSGSYWNLGAKAIFGITGSVYGTVGYDYREFKANTEDAAHEHAFRLGISIPLGGSSKAGDLFNNLSAQTLPYRSASYGEVLD